MLRVVNVASVPQRSPFRYPGGKTWLVPMIRSWLRHKGGPSKTLVEPFAGGGIVSLTAVAEDLVSRAILVEKDEDIAAVWRTMLGQNGSWLVSEIAAFEMTSTNVHERLDSAAGSLRERAFQAILRNRVNRGGILAPGAGRVKNGENGKGLASRWYPKTLCRRIREIREIRDRLEFVEGDGFEVAEQNAGDPSVVWFIDPPYTVAGRRLYKYSEIDHEKLFSLSSRLAGDVVLTYDDSEYVRQLAETSGFDVCEVPMKNTHHSRKIELLIGKRLDWVLKETPAFL